MNRFLSLVLFLAAFPLFAQGESREVTFKIFPSDYQIFFQGSRLGYHEDQDGLRVYRLPPQDLVLTVSQAGFQPRTLAVSSSLTRVEAKLEPKDPGLELRAEGPTGKGPRSLAFSADGKRLFVVYDQENYLEVFDRSSLKSLAQTAVEPNLGTLAEVFFMKEQNEVWAATTGGKILVFNGEGTNLKEILPWGGSGTVSVDVLDPHHLAFIAQDEGVVYLFDAGQKKGEKSFTVGGSPRGAASDGTHLYISRFDTGKLAVASLDSAQVDSVWDLGGAPRPVAVAGGRIFVADMANGALTVVKAPEGTVETHLEAGSNPHELALSPDGRLLAVALRGRNNPEDYTKEGPDFGKVLLFDTQTLEKRAEVFGRNQPTGLSFSPDGKYLAFADLLDRNLEVYRVNR